MLRIELGDERETVELLMGGRGEFSSMRDRTGIWGVVTKNGHPDRRVVATSAYEVFGPTGPVRWEVNYDLDGGVVTTVRIPE